MPEKKNTHTATRKPLHEGKSAKNTIAASLREEPQEAWNEKLRFIDLFCGIGGFRIAFEKQGAKCVFSSDYDKFSQHSYEANYGEKPHGDIHTVAVADIPSHDILCGGFPCQPFSIAGVSKKNSLGRAHGFDDVKQGNLFFAIAEILDYHRPAAFVLENVKNLQSHDKGNTFRIITCFKIKGTSQAVA
jgi:DNA (cytosine-5)-methyltransferase 1